MKKITLLIAMFIGINYSYSQIEIKQKPTENKKILITSDIMLGLPHFIKFSLDYNQNLFTYGVSAGVLAGDVHVGIRPLVFKDGQISILGVYGVTAVGKDYHTSGSSYYGGYIDVILVKHLKLNLGYTAYDNRNESGYPYINIGYCFNLYKNN